MIYIKLPRTRYELQQITQQRSKNYELDEWSSVCTSVLVEWNYAIIFKEIRGD